MHIEPKSSTKSVVERKYGFLFFFQKKSKKEFVIFILK